MEEHNSISEVRIAPFPQHSPPAPSCQGLSYNFSEPFYEEMNQEHREYFGSKSHLMGSSSQSCECQSQPLQHWELVLLCLISAAPCCSQGCFGDALLPFWDKMQLLWPKKHQLKGLTFALKEKTLPLLEADSYSGCGHPSWLRAGL